MRVMLFNTLILRSSEAFAARHHSAANFNNTT